MAWATALDNLNATVRDTFPATAIYTSVIGGAPYAITCVHDFRWLEVSGPDGQAVSAQRHVAFVRLGDLGPQPVQGDGLQITSGPGANTYEVVDVQADGGGGATLVLMVS